MSAVVLTGGSSGIGKSFIELCAKLRPELCFCNLSRSAPVINLPQLKLRHVPCDLSDAEAVKRGAEAVLEWLSREAPAGRVLLINNSGFGAYGRFPEPNLSEQLQLLDVNIRALVELTGRLLPELKKRGGAVLNVASTAAFQAMPFMATYGASKAFVLHWSVALDEELRGSGVRSIAVCPGPTETKFFERAGLKPGSVRAERATGMTAEAVVEEALRGLAAGRAVVVAGFRNKLTAIAGALAPKRFGAWVAGKLVARSRLAQLGR